MISTSFKGAMLGAGVGLYFFAFAVGYAYPAFFSKHDVPKVKDIYGNIVEVRPYTPQEKLGREVYIKEACWICHSQFVRPIGGDEKRYGPVSQAGEFSYDKPHTFGTRRIGPDLAREGGKRTDGWQYGHLADPQAMTQGSIMPKYVWYFEKNEKGEADITKPTEEGKALVAYLQRLGTSIGDWRNPEGNNPNAKTATVTAPKFTAQMVTEGKTVYDMNCAGCHGATGAGDGAAAAALNPKPRNFVKADYKYPVNAKDEDIFKTLEKGVAGSAMPGWKDSLSESQRWSVISYIRTFKK
ncbi:MAG: cbb3-type cytochrome c oxidase subunit II [Cyanobacteriota bacterium]